ncbi:lipoprotein [Spiroplasma phoeniceum]|uniref:Spiroplasma plectrovirus-related protein n=1 Tax=Spiroplasma phoeniceum P40 TaxID=1276259 RepID=A0A345DR11_9MOLU|nr:lipoprotein [Spiroplasma phoeniceum]AXF96652.1 spiroplasma plectrovirus-related protein [Spiroplasma phoeniceum P40]
MKKWLSIIGAIGLTPTSTTTLISCKKENNNENGGGDNKPEPQYNPQQPPEGSNWKIITDYNYFDNNIDDNWYFFILKNEKESKLKEIKFINNSNNAYGIIESNGFIFSKYLIKNSYLQKGLIKGLYRWDGNGEPQIPTIDKNTGKITDWKEQKGT